MSLSEQTAQAIENEEQVGVVSALTVNGDTHRRALAARAVSTPSLRRAGQVPPDRGGGGFRAERPPPPPRAKGSSPL